MQQKKLTKLHRFVYDSTHFLLVTIALPDKDVVNIMDDTPLLNVRVVSFNIAILTQRADRCHKSMLIQTNSKPVQEKRQLV